MPTGYTEMIDSDPDLTTAKWVTEGLARAFGVCIILRDDSMSLSEMEIEKRLEDEIERGISYYKEKLEETQEALMKLKTDSNKYLKEEYEKYIKNTDKHNNKSLKEAAITKLRHEQVRQDLKKLLKETTDDVTRNLAKYGLNQLDIVENETEPYIYELPSFGKFKEDKINSLNKDLDYYVKEINETRERETEKLQVYRKIKSEVNRILNQ